MYKAFTYMNPPMPICCVTVLGAWLQWMTLVSWEWEATGMSLHLGDSGKEIEGELAELSALL